VAIRDFALEPDRPGSRLYAEMAGGIRTYHLRFSRERARGPDGLVRRPRHVLVYRLLGNTRLTLIRVLHDAMEVERHLPHAAQRRSDDG
jgi:toxin ParE1/3/4